MKEQNFWREKKKTGKVTLITHYLKTISLKKICSIEGLQRQKEGGN
jgi:hypothetical protein